MALVFDDIVQSVQLDTSYISAMDFTNNGSLLAVSYHPREGGNCTRVYRTADASLVGEYGSGSGLGVVFSGQGEHLYYLIRLEEGDCELCIVVPGKSMPSRIATYGNREMLHALRRNFDGRFIAILGNAVEIWDMAAQEVIRFKEALNTSVLVHAWFNRDGSHLYIYGLHDSEVTGLDVNNDVIFGSWPALTSTGKQVIVSFSEEYLVTVAGAPRGVFIYHLPSNIRYQPQVYNQDFFAQPFLFSHDSSLLITLEVALRGEYLATDEVVTGPELPVGIPSAVASAWQAPIVAYAIKDSIYWVRLINQ
ncbi:MAG: hypothetical protein KDI79_23790 [Anaerolineae bacterium]|nr:hypothetical protein [Anaerolineae bacterium]